MVVKDFSPIQSGITYIKPNSSDFQGSEYFFVDTNPQLYCLVSRKDNFKDSDRYYLLGYLRLQGYDNGDGYSYRIDLEKYIYTPQFNIDLSADINNSDVYKFTLPDNSNDFNIMFHTSDMMSETGFTQYITTQTNGIIYIDLSSKTNCDNYVYDYLSLKVADNSFSFPRQVYSSDLYTCSKFMVGFGQELVASGSEVFTGTTTTTTTTASPTTTTTTTATPTTTTTTTSSPTTTTTTTTLDCTLLGNIQNISCYLAGTIENI